MLHHACCLEQSLLHSGISFCLTFVLRENSVWLCCAIGIVKLNSFLCCSQTAASRALIDLIPTLVLFSTNMAMPHEALTWCFLEKCMCSSHTLQVLASARLCLYRITLALHCGKKRVDRTINLCALGIVSLFPHGWLKECYF